MGGYLGDEVGGAFDKCSQGRSAASVCSVVGGPLGHGEARAHGDCRDDGEGAFGDHSAVAYELCVGFAINLFRGGAGGYEGVEPGDRAAGYDYEEHGEEGRGVGGNVEGRGRGGHCGVDDDDAEDYDGHADDEHSAVHEVTGLEEPVDGKGGGEEDVCHEYDYPDSDGVGRHAIRELAEGLPPDAEHGAAPDAEEHDDDDDCGPEA